MLNIISLYLFFAVLLTIYITSYVFSRGRSGYLKAFSALSFCISIYLFGYLMELNSANIHQMIFWNQIQYFGVPFFPALLLAMALLYTERIRILKRWMLLKLFIIPIITFFMRFTNSYHYLFYKSMKMEQISGYSILLLEKGPWYFVQTFYIISSLIILNIVFYLDFRKNSWPYKSRFMVLLAATILPFIGVIMNLFNYTGFGIDYTALFMPLTLLLTMFAIFKYDFLEIKNLAYETIFKNNSLGMILLDKNFKIIDFNKAAQDFFSILNIFLGKYSIENVLGHKEELVDIFRNETTRNYRFIKDGQERFYEFNSLVIKNANKRNIGMLKSIRDITEKEKMQEKLRILASIDALSNLNNRGHFMHLARLEFERAVRYNQEFSLLIMDADHFKSINDTYGHAAGDAVIQEIGKLINTNFRKIDISGRIGGEEFAIVMPNTSINYASLVAERFRKTVAETKIIYENFEIGITVSIGVAAFFTEAKNIDEILKIADKALYEAKIRGRNCMSM